MLRVASRAFVTALVLASLTACGASASLGKIRTAGAADSTKKDCAACKKMCEVGGSNEKNDDGAKACIKDCEKSCQ